MYTTGALNVPAPLAETVQTSPRTQHTCVLRARMDMLQDQGHRIAMVHMNFTFIKTRISMKLFTYIMLMLMKSSPNTRSVNSYIDFIYMYKQ